MRDLVFATSYDPKGVFSDKSVTYLSFYSQESPIMDPPTIYGPAISHYVAHKTLALGIGDTLPITLKITPQLGKVDSLLLVGDSIFSSLRFSMRALQRFAEQRKMSAEEAKKIICAQLAHDIQNILNARDRKKWRQSVEELIKYLGDLSNPY